MSIKSNLLKSETWCREWEKWFNARRSAFYPKLFYWFAAALHISFMLYEPLMTLFLKRRKMLRGIAGWLNGSFNNIKRFHLFKFVEYWQSSFVKMVCDKYIFIIILCWNCIQQQWCSACWDWAGSNCSLHILSMSSKYSLCILS